MKKLIIAIIPILFIRCDNEECNCVSTPTDDRIPFEINFLEYSDNKYFIDEVYTDTSSELNMYNLYYGSNPPVVLPKYYVKEIEVYKSTNQILSSVIYAHAYVDLPSRSFSDKYSDSLRYNYDIIPGQHELGRFRLLNEGGEYFFHRETGYITFVSPLNEYDLIAIAYRIENESTQYSDDMIYGEFFSDLIRNRDSIAVLKHIKPKNLQPQFRTAWKLKMKNMYQILPYQGKVSNVDLDIYLKKADGSESNTINGIGLLELFGFDKFKENGEVGPDGKFDNLLGININSSTSEIIFPVIEPFGGNIPPELIDYKYQAIYDTVKTYVPLPENYFIIKGKYNPY